MTLPIEISVQAQLQDPISWVALAQRCERIGIRALLVGDHPGVGESPFVTLAAAAVATKRLRLGSYVVNAGVREAIHIAADVATLDVVSAGRAEVGLGAGHTPLEWENVGRRRPDARSRSDRLVRVASAVQRLLRGEVVPADDLDVLADVELRAPRPVQPAVPVLVGGTNPAILRWGGAHADAVGLTGLGRTGSDGHSHAVHWTADRVDQHVDVIRAAAASAGRPTPPLEALVHVVEITDDVAAVAGPLADELDIGVQDLLEVPYVLIGSEEEMLDKMRAAAERWGITRWVVREPALDTVELLIRRSREDPPG